MRTRTSLCLILFLVVIHHANGQVKVPELYLKIQAHMPIFLHKSERLFKRKLILTEKIELKKKYGDDVFEKLTFFPDFIGMKFPKHRKLNTNNKYENFKKLRFSKRKGFVRNFIVFKDTVIGILETTSLNDVVDLDIKMQWRNPDEREKIYSEYQAEFDTLRKYSAYIEIVLENSGYNIVLNKEGNIRTTYQCPSGNRSPECLISLEEGLQRDRFKDWRHLFK